jgi:hypothetical protein
MKHLAWSVLFAVLAGAGCGSPRVAPAEPERAAEVRLPPSALATAVRALQALDVLRPADVLVQLRALECDVLPLDGGGPAAEHVRLFLHVTAYADTPARAGAAFEALRSGLAEAPLETAPVAPERVVSALAALDWSPTGREDLASYSDAIRLEVAATAAPALERTEAARRAALARGELGEWVRSVAARELAGPVVLDVQPRAAPAGTAEVRCRIRDLDDVARHSRGEIGGFLAALESESPAARLTHFELERSQHEPDPEAVRGWTFEAELTVRVRADEARVAPPPAAPAR